MMSEPTDTHVTGQPARSLVKFGPVPFRELVDYGNRWLIRELSRTLQSLDAGLDELASKSMSNASQNYYFQAMCDMRRMRGQIVSSWKNSWIAQFEVGEPGAAEEDGLEGLTLLDKDAQEEEVSIRVIAEKAMEHYLDPIKALTERMNEVLQKTYYVPDKNPFSPHPLIDNCRRTLISLDLDLEIRLQVYRAFDQGLLANLGTLLDTSNERLSKSGILPDLKITAVAKKPAKQAAEKTPSAKQPQTDDEDSAHVFSALRELLQHRAGFGTNRGLGGAAVAGRALSTQELVATLAQLQTNTASHDSFSGRSPSLGELVGSHLADDQAGPARAKAIDADTISLVSMLFEALLSQRDLAPQIGDVLSRLQVPVLRLALTDREVFSNQEHPVRVLLNEFAEAAVGWELQGPLEQDKLYCRIGETVKQICDAEEQDAGLFQSAVDQFAEYSRANSRKALLLKERLAAAEKGRAQLEDARRVVDRVLGRRLTRASLPSAVTDFIEQRLSRWLQLVFIREGVASVSWKQALNNINVLFAAYPSSNGSPSSVGEDEFTQLLDDMISLLAGVGQDSYALSEYFEKIVAERASLVAASASGNSAELAERSATISVSEGEDDALGA